MKNLKKPKSNVNLGSNHLNAQIIISQDHIDMADSKSEEEKMQEEPGMSSYIRVPEENQKTNGPCQKA